MHEAHIRFLRCVGGANAEPQMDGVDAVATERVHSSAGQQRRSTKAPAWGPVASISVVAVSITIGSGTETPSWAPTPTTPSAVAISIIVVLGGGSDTPTRAPTPTGTVGSVSVYNQDIDNYIRTHNWGIHSYRQQPRQPQYQGATLGANATPPGGSAPAGSAPANSVPTGPAMDAAMPGGPDENVCRCVSRKNATVEMPAIAAPASEIVR